MKVAMPEFEERNLVLMRFYFPFEIVLDVDCYVEMIDE